MTDDNPKQDPTAAQSVKDVNALAKIAKAADPADNVRSADQMADRLIDNLASDPRLAKDLQKSPELVREYADVAKVETDAATLRNYDLEIIKSNGNLYLTVVGCIGGMLILVVLSIAILSLYQLTMMGAPINGSITIFIPDSLIALGSAAIGALAGLLTPLTGRR
ncbi:hypothetical protein ACO2RV_07795 [Ancylobacter sp. VNQ12]|uniref:hypothetical protein n=1 Tax=Ancylobacter sp. VNQ12 TaxID=3400920 RepID=UPI003C1086F3